jgi:hypothetical protein
MMSQSKVPFSLVLLVSGLLFVSARITAQAQGAAGAGLKNAVILIIRHGEKPDKGDDLSKEGKKRAKAYVSYFRKFRVDSQPLRLDYLFAAADTKDSHRPRLTLEPLSKAIGLPINSQYECTHNEQLVGAIQAQPSAKTTLICWHHEQIPQLVTALGADPKTVLGDKKWPDDVFGWVIQLRYDSAGNLTQAKRISENLMPDDSGK